MELQLKIVGVLLVILSLSHIIFPHYFKWRDELSLISHINRQMVYVHTFFIAFIIFLMGLLCLTSSAELISTQLGKRISLGLGAFWSVRLGFQFLVYSTQHWKGKKFETGIHVLFSIVWIYLSTTFILAYLS